MLGRGLRRYKGPSAIRQLETQLGLELISLSENREIPEHAF